MSQSAKGSIQIKRLGGNVDSRAERVLKHFTLLGSSVGKALQDGRLMDIYLAPAFWDLMIAHVTKGAWSREVTPREVDPALAATLDKLRSTLVSPRRVRSALFEARRARACCTRPCFPRRGGGAIDTPTAAGGASLAGLSPRDEVGSVSAGPASRKCGPFLMRGAQCGCVARQQKMQSDGN